MQHQQHDFMTTWANCVTTKKIYFCRAKRGHIENIYCIFILELNARWSPKARAATDSRLYTLANILLVLKISIKVYNYI